MNVAKSVELHTLWLVLPTGGAKNLTYKASLLNVEGPYHLPWEYYVSNLIDWQLFLLCSYIKGSLKIVLKGLPAWKWPL